MPQEERRAYIHQAAFNIKRQLCTLVNLISSDRRRRRRSALLCGCARRESISCGCRCEGRFRVPREICWAVSPLFFTTPWILFKWSLGSSLRCLSESAWNQLTRTKIRFLVREKLFNWELLVHLLDGDWLLASLPAGRLVVLFGLRTSGFFL